MIRSTDICVVTPTYRRASQLGRMLGGLANQSAMVGKIIIADGGGDAGAIANDFADRLPLVVVECPSKGQIAQRNYALGFVDDDFYIILYMDDDIVLDINCIKTLVKFWNSQKIEPAGVGLNIVNMPKQNDNMLRRLFIMGARPMGRVLASGYNTPVTGVPVDLEAQWLTGGATAWRRDILRKYRNAPVPTSWAVGEDLMFSYPISKVERLVVCAAALCDHVDEAPPITFSGGRFRAYRGVVSRYVFVRANPELRQVAFFWMIFGQLLGRLVRGIAGRRSEWGYLLGTAEALRDCLANSRRTDVNDLLSDRAH